MDRYDGAGYADVLCTGPLRLVPAMQARVAASLVGSSAAGAVNCILRVVDSTPPLPPVGLSLSVSLRAAVLCVLRLCVVSV